MAIKQISCPRAPAALGVLLVLGVLGTQVLYSSPATFQQASNAAASFLAMRYPRPVPSTVQAADSGAKTRLAIKSVQALSNGGPTLGYLARLEPSGFVVMRSDLDAPPVKLHSDSGDFEALPPGFAKVILLELAEELEYLRTTPAPSPTAATPYARQWSAMESSTKSKLALSSVPVGDANTTLLTTSWNQNDPYNYYAPSASGGPGGRAWAGCVATALGQILRFHGEPTQIGADHTYTDNAGSCKGTHAVSDAGMGAYDWANMPLSINSGSTLAQKKAIGQLLYHCGVILEANFEAGATGAGVETIPSVVSSYFGYTSGAYELKASYSSSQWYNKVAASLDANKPVFYAMYTAGYGDGHAVVCDGYRNGNEIHLNLGWSGSYTAWYNIDSVKANVTWTIHSAIFGIAPQNGSGPVITLQPQGFTSGVGSQATLSVSATGTPTPKFQWRKAGKNLAGNSASNLSFTSLALADAGQYDVVAKNSFGNATSGPVTLSVVDAVRITQQPTGVVAKNGATVTFGVQATPATTVTYQWNLNGAPVANATSNRLTLTGVSTNQEGNYSVIVSNLVNAVESHTAKLAVLLPPTITQIPKTMTGDEGAGASASITATGRDPLSYAWFKTGSKTPLQTGATLTLTNLSTSDKGSYFAVLTNTDGKVTSAAIALALNEVPRWTTPPKYSRVKENGRVTFSGAATGVKPMTYYWFATTNFLSATTNASLSLTKVQTNLECTFMAVASNRLGTAASAAFGLYVIDVPAITQIPKSVSGDEGTNVDITVTATGREPLNYSWYKTGAKTILQTGATLTLSTLSTNDKGSYYVVITNADGKITSPAVPLILNELPRWTSSPKDITVLKSNTLTLAASAKGAAPMSYLWYANSDWLATTAKGTLAIAGIPTNSAGAYFVIASNRIGTATSPTFQVKVSDPPAFAKQPAGGSVKQEATLTLSVDVIGKPPMTYVWKKSNVVIAGATDSSLVITNVRTSDAGPYKVVASNDDGTKESAVATVTVIAKPVFTLQPAAVTGTNGQKISLTATATGTGISYQWQRDGANVAGATAATCKVTIGANTAGSYVVAAKNAWGTVSSDPAAVAIGSVSTVPPALTSPYSLQVTRQPETWLSWPGGTVTFAPEIAGATGQTRYQWYHNGSRIADGTAPTLMVRNIQPADAGRYHLEIADSDQTMETEAGELLVARNVTESRIVQALPGEILAVAQTAKKLPILLFRAQPNSAYRLERSVDGRTWQNVASGTPESSVSQFIDEAAGNIGFYRVLIEPK